MNLSEKIMLLRKRQNWSQEELAERMGVSRQSVSKWESGASVPELERVAQMCALFGVTADALIRDDLVPGDLPEPAAVPGHPLMTLEDVYACVSNHQTVARKMALGVAACVASPALVVLFSDVSGKLTDVIGLPAMFLMIAWAVWQFINTGTLTSRYRFVEKRQFSLAADALEWVREAREQFRPALIRDIALGVALCILSPMPTILLDAFAYDSPLLECAGPALLLVLVAWAVFLFVRSVTMLNCYQRLLKDKDV